jgi:ketosteroid isomerase-like protein
MGQNESIIRDAYAHFAKGEFTAKLDIFADDITWRSSGAPNRVATAGEWRGMKGVCAYFAELFREWQILAFDVVEVIGHDDRRFVARITLELQNNVTGSHVRLEKVDFLTMENGRCTSFAEIFDAAPVERAARFR